MTQPPRRNLPPDAEAWGRWAEQSILTDEQKSLEASQGISNSLAAINGSLSLISQQIAQLQTGPASIASYFTEVGPQSSQPVPTVNATRYYTRPSWAMKASVLIINEAIFAGDPTVFSAVSDAEIWPDLLNPIRDIAGGAIVQINGDNVRRASASKTFVFNSAALADATQLRMDVTVSRDALPSGRSVAYITNGFVFWNA